MLRYTLAAGLLLSLTACKYNKEGVYIAYFPDADDLICGDITIKENITDADPPDDVTTTSDWVFSDEATQSDAVVFVQLFEDKSGDVILQIGNSVYTGTSDGGVEHVRPSQHRERR